ncbi:MAG: LacI family DNA-binding transcriptional regulator [Robiginitomaculum sp.]
MNSIRKVTIEDIAREAGVSMKTVSRVFNHEPNVRETTRERVMETAKAMKYRPNVAARGLASNKSYVFVHFHDNPNPDYLERIHQGIHKICRANGYFAVMEPLPIASGSYAEQVTDYVTEFAIGGIILSPPLCDDKALLESLIARAIPFVRLSPSHDLGISSHTFVDDKAAAMMMTDHLIALGHKDIAFISGPPHHGAAQARRNGFVDSIKTANLNLKSCPIMEGDFSFHSGYKAYEQLARLGANPSAIFAANDDMAAGAMVAALKAGRDIPGDLSIGGFDGSRVGEIMWPPLTTIRQPIRGLAEQATELLLAHIRDPEKVNVSAQLPVSLIKRGSSAPFKG